MTRAEFERQLSAWLSVTDIGLLELRGPELQLCLRNVGGRVQTAAADAARKITHGSVSPVRAPTVGRFLHAHPLHAAPLVVPGQAVVRGQTIGLLQVGVLLLPVQAPQHGTVAAHASADGAVVGYGTPLVDLLSRGPEDT